MTLGQVADDIAQVFGIPAYASAPAVAKARLLIDINAAIEQILLAGEDFYGRETVSQTLTAGTAQYLLAKNVQSVLEPVTLSDGTMLRKLTSYGQLQQFAQLFLDEDTAENGKPLAYFVKTVRDTTGGESDSVKIILYVLPTPDADNDDHPIELNVIKEPTLVSAADLTAGTATLAVPDKYVEAVFLPLARYNATGSFLFYDKEKKPQIEADYQRALAILDSANPERHKPIDSRIGALAIPRQKESPPQRAPANEP